MTTTHSDTSSRTNVRGARQPEHSDAARRALPITIWTEVMIAFGLAIVVVPWVRQDLFNWIATGSSSQPGNMTDEAFEYLRLSLSLVGALTFGLAISMWFIARYALAKGQAWGWNALAVTIGAWFIVDSAASIATGFPRNAISNVLLTLPAVAALWYARPAVRT